MLDTFQDAIILDIPIVMKSQVVADGRRIVSVEASSETVDSQGDIVLQKALLDSAISFVANGHLDIDHYSELGDRLGIPNPLSYIIGRPLSVKDLGGGRTGVVGEIARSPDGTYDPKNRRYDEFWESLQSEPPVRWRASIFGYPMPDMVEDCRDGGASYGGATRFVIKGIDWRSLAFTRNPVNTDLQGYAKIVSAKSHVEAIIKSRLLAKDHGAPGQPGSAEGVAGIPSDLPALRTASSVPVIPTYAQLPMDVPKSMDELVGQHARHIFPGHCPYSDALPSTLGFSVHFRQCCGADGSTAEILSRALMHYLLTQ
jgi:hypothetical protein